MLDLEHIGMSNLTLLLWACSVPARETADTPGALSTCSEGDLDASSCGDSEQGFSTEDPEISDEFRAAVYSAWKEMMLARSGMTEAEFDEDFTVESVTQDEAGRVDINLTAHVDWNLSETAIRVYVSFDEWADNPKTGLQTSIADSLDDYPIHDIPSLLCWSDLMEIVADCEAQLGAAPGSLVLDPCSGDFDRGTANLTLRADGEINREDNHCGVLFLDVETGTDRCMPTDCYDPK